MSLLSICRQVANEIPVSPPDTIIDNTDQTARLLLALAQDAGEWVARRSPGGWVSLIREYVFQTKAVGPLSGSIANTGAGGVAQITGLSSTAGIVANTWAAFGTGIPNNTLVQAVDSATQVTLTLPAVQTGVGQFQFGQSDYALPADFRWFIDGTMWDRTRYWALRGPMSPQQWQQYKSSPIGKASIQRRWRTRYKNGAQVFSIDPVPVDNGAYLVFEYMSKSWCQSDENVAQVNWQADTDTSILDEYLIQLSLRWRVLRRQGLSYQEELDECERETAKAIMHEGGAAVLDLTPSPGLSLIGPWNVPESGFGGVVG